jgi:UDP-glucose 4-epimerase
MNLNPVGLSRSDVSSSWEEVSKIYDGYYYSNYGGNDMKVVVTGGAGFIGSHLVEILVESGYEVIVIDSLVSGKIENLRYALNKVQIFNLSLQDCNADELVALLKGVRTVVHLAALADIVPSIENPTKYFDNNVSSTIALLEACKKAGVGRIVYAASSSCYGEAPQTPTSEDHLIDCCYPYALTKYLGEELVLHWSKVYGIEACSLRLFNVYGPRARTAGTYGAVLGVFLAQKFNQVPLTIVGDGTQKRDFIYVTDVARAFTCALNVGSAQGVFNVALGIPRSIIELSTMISNEIVHIPKRPGEPEITWGNPAKFQRNFDWKPTITLEEGVELCLSDLSWIQQAPVWTPEKIELATSAWFKYLGKE